MRFTVAPPVRRTKTRFFVFAVLLALVASAAVAADEPRTFRVRGEALRAELLESGATLIADYGSYAVFEVDARRAATLERRSDAELIEESRFIFLNAGAIDTKRTAHSHARTASFASAGRSMHLVHFKAAIKPEWYRDLEATGVEIVTYIPENSYLVYGNPAAIHQLHRMAELHSAVDWEGEYTPEHRVDPRIARRSKNAEAKTAPDYFAIQLIKDRDANPGTLAFLQSMKSTAFEHRYEILNYVNFIAIFPPAAIEQIARRQDVVSVQPYVVPEMMDERQDIIIAGSLTGNGPTAPGYHAWLAGEGFTQAQFDASNILVDVCDSGVDNANPAAPNHFGLHRLGVFGNSRLVYARREPAGAGTIQGCDGHGNINAHIVAGYNDFNVSPHQDAAGYKYGLGVAPHAKVGSSVIFDPNYTFPVFPAMASRTWNDGARISTNSWGANVNGAYNSDSQAYDALVRDAAPAGSAFPLAGNQEMLYIFAAGNAGSGASTVGSPGTGKNVLTVGASENVHPFGGNDGCGIGDSGADSANDIIFFSSRGPTTDGRIKPDIVAPGTHVTGGVAQASQNSAGTGAQLACFDATGVCAGVANNFFPAGQQFYTASSGTSHSTPAVAGGAALARQWFTNEGMAAPSPALAKAFLMNSTRYMNGVGANDNLYSNSQGMGMMNLGTAFSNITRFYRDQDPVDMFTASGQVRTWTGSVADNGQPVRFTLAWTDAPGATSGNAYRNNLDLTVVVDGITYLGNVFSGANSVTGGSADVRNNVESVFLPAGTSGAVVITVTATNINSDGVPNVGGALDQDFALVASNVTTATLPVIVADGSALIAESCPPGNNAIDPGETVTIDFSLRNAGTADTSDVVATLQATGGVTSPSAPQNYGALLAGGANATHSFTFTASATCGNEIIATFDITDAGNPMGQVTFNLATGTIVTVISPVFANTAAITIPTSGNGSPYPSNVTVSGWTLPITNLKVKLNGLSHTWPGDIDILLVAPSGEKFIVMSDVGEVTTDVSGLLLEFTDGATLLPGSTPVSGTFAPANYAGSFGPEPDTFAAPAPAGPYASPAPTGSATFGSTFGAATANGTWSLYVRDDATGDAGSIATGWSLELINESPSCCLPPATIVLSNAAYSAGEGAGTVTVTVNRIGDTSGAVSATLTTSDVSATAGSDYTAVSTSVDFLAGETTKTVDITIAQDSLDESDETFDVTLSAPTGGAILGAPATAVVTITDDDVSPAITSLSPNNGIDTGGTSVVITGTDFGPGATVTIGGVPATSVTVDSPTQITIVTPARPPGTLHDVVVTNVDANSGTLVKGWLSDFLDVPQSHGLHNFVEAIFRAGITGGCGGGNYCLNNSTTRAQMAVFLLVAKEGTGYAPPPATGTMFGDVPANGFAAAWIEELANRGITGGCGGGNYCPNNAVTRSQMAVFLLATYEPSGYVPPAAVGIFDDVLVGNGFAPWIEELYNRGITGGCSVTPKLYCPSNRVTRGQMAVFLTTTWSLPMN